MMTTTNRSQPSTNSNRHLRAYLFFQVSVTMTISRSNKRADSGRKIAGCLLLLCCLVSLFGCAGINQAPEKRELSEQFYENLLTAFQGHNYALVQTGLDKINEAGIADKRTRYLEALMALINRDPDTAIIKLKDALVMDPDYAEAHNALGTIYMQQEKYDLAESELLQAADNPLYQTPEKAYQNLGNLYKLQGKELQAKGCYNKAINLNQDYFPAHYELSRLYFAGGNLQLAREEMDKAKIISPEHPGVWLQMGMIEDGLGEREKAIEAFNKVLELAPKSSFADQAAKELKRIDNSNQ